MQKSIRTTWFRIAFILDLLEGKLSSSILYKSDNITQNNHIFETFYSFYLERTKLRLGFHKQVKLMWLACNILTAAYASCSDKIIHIVEKHNTLRENIFLSI